jgi:hypothetical protein
VAVGPGWNAYNQIVSVGDDDGDGDGELVARDIKGTLWYHTGNGDGTFAPRVQIGPAGSSASAQQFGGAGNNPVAATKEGVLARDTAGTMFWYSSWSTGLLTKRRQYGDTGEWRGANYTHLSSLDPDGSSDVAEIYNNGLYIDGAYIGAGWNIYSALVGPGDLTGDGRADLLARDSSGVLYLHPGNGLGTKFAARIRLGAGWNGYDRIFGAGDYTGDGRADLLARTPSGDLYLFAGTGSATTPFKARQKVGYGWNAYTKVIAPGDLNADGKGDLLGVTSGGDLYSYLNTTPGKFTGRAKIGYGFQIYNAMS